MRNRGADVLEISYEEADLLAYLADSFIEDNAKTLGFSVGTEHRQKFARDVIDKLRRFTAIERRCGATGPANSVGDFPSCVRRPHARGMHKAIDPHTMQVRFWRGNRFPYAK